MSRYCFLTLDSHLFVFFLLLFFWFSCALSCSSEPVISRTGTSIHISVSLFGMAAISNLHFYISAKNATHSDSIKIANEVSTFINPRSLKIVMLNDTSSLDSLELNFLVRMSISGKSAKRTLTGYLASALGKSTQELSTYLTCNVTTCEGEQTNVLELSECTRIEWKFSCSSSPVLTVLSSEAQSNVMENPIRVSQAAAAAVFSGDGAAAEASLNLSGIDSETSSTTAAGAPP